MRRLTLMALCAMSMALGAMNVASIQPAAADGGWRYVAPGGSDATGESHGLVNEGGWWVEGLTIRNAERDGMVSSGREIHVTNMIVRDNNQCRNHPTAADCGAPDPVVGYGGGMTLQSVQYGHFIRNTVTGNSTGFLVTDGTTNSFGVVLRVNTANGNAASGIALVARATPAQSVVYGIHHPHLYGNETSGNEGAGVLMTETAPSALVVGAAVVDSIANENETRGARVLSARVSRPERSDRRRREASRR